MADGREYIGICIECKSDQPASYMERSSFMRPSCKYCGGVVHIIDARANRDEYLNRQDSRRGIGITHDKVDPTIRNNYDDED